MGLDGFSLARSVAVVFRSRWSCVAKLSNICTDCDEEVVASEAFLLQSSNLSVKFVLNPQSDIFRIESSQPEELSPHK